MAHALIYKEIYSKIKQQIVDGTYEVGDFLPTEGELEELFDVSRTTVRKAVDLLVKDGFLEVKQGRGTKVLDNHISQKLNGVTSVSETLRKRGYEVVTKSIYIEKTEAQGKTCHLLDVPEGTPLYKIQRVLLADGIPTAILENFIREDFAPDIDQHASEIKSLYAYLEHKYGHVITSSSDIISAKNAEFLESELLDIKPGTAVLTIKRVSFEGDVPLTYDRTTVRADKYQFEINPRGRE